MRSPPSIVTLLAAPLFAPAVLGGGAASDAVLIVRAKVTDAALPLAVGIHREPGTTPSSLGPALATDETFKLLTGDDPVRFVFTGDAAGDGEDEIFDVRAHLADPQEVLRLRAFLPPPVFGGSTGGAVASSKPKTLGYGTGPDRILAIGAGDADGDSKDEALMVLEADGGDERVEVRRLPRKKNQSMAKVKASAGPLMAASSDRTIAVCAADWDGDGKDEIVLLEQKLIAYWVEVIAMPASIGEAPQVLASWTPLPLQSGVPPRAIARVRFDGDSPDEIGILFSSGAGPSRFAVHDLPGVPGDLLPTPLFQDAGFDPAEDDHAVVTMASLRGFTFASPAASLAGTWSATLQHLVVTTPETIAIEGIVAIQSGATVTVALPLFNVWQAEYSSTAGTIDFGNDPVELDAPGTGSKYSLTLAPGIAYAGSEGTWLQGTYTGTKHLPLGQTAPLTEGTWRFLAKP